MKKRYIFTAILGMILFISLIYIIERLINFDSAKLETYVTSFGILGPIILLFVIIITSSIGFIYLIPIALTALLFNSYLAFLISIVGLTLGATISFFASRYFARDFVQRNYIKSIKGLKKYDEKLQKNGFFTILFLRFISFIPYEIINIAAGLSKIRFLPFILATFVGIIPGAILTIYLIKNVSNAGSIHFFIASLLMALFFCIPLVFKKVRNLVFSLE